MKTIAILFLFMGLNIAFSQEVYRKQITFLDGADCKNFTAVDPFNHNRYFAFEADFGNKTNIFLGHYNTANDTFLIDINVTDNNFRNTNPSLVETINGLLIVYQTNENGNLDIAYKYYNNDTLSERYFLTNNPNDEFNPMLPRIIDPYSNTDIYVSYQVAYLQGIGVNVKNLSSLWVPEAVVFFPSGDNFYYPAFTEYHDGYVLKYLVAASVDSSDSHHYIVSRSMKNDVWEEKVLLREGEVENLDASGDNYSELAFDAIDSLNGRRNIFLLDVTDPANIKKIYDTAPYDIFDLHTKETFYIGDEFPHAPFAFKALINDSLFISSRKISFTSYYGDTLIYTKVKTSSLGVCRLDPGDQGDIFYSVWQDSVNGHIQLFGRKNYEPFGAVTDKVTPVNFTLQQNYPNPFNPSTTIDYTLNKGAQIKLTIYSLLGEVVAVPLNEYQSAGEHKVTFNAKNLSSGIYFYELSSGGVRSVRKMSLIK